MMGKYKDISGKKFGRLTAIKRVGADKQRRSLWLCKCECGNKTKIRLPNLTTGITKSCGCLQKDIVAERLWKHGLSVDANGNTPRLYGIWRNMKQRCFNSKASKYYLYGGKNIKVYKEWLEYKPFHEWALSNGYKDNLTIDRIDGDKDYCPENCRWATRKQQSRNTSQNHLITYRGRTKTLAGWAEELGIKQRTLSSRLLDYGWNIKKAFIAPVGQHNKRIATYKGETKSLSEWADVLGISYKLLYKRVYTRGWSIDRAFNQSVKGA